MGRGRRCPQCAAEVKRATIDAKAAAILLGHPEMTSGKLYELLGSGRNSIGFTPMWGAECAARPKLGPNGHVVVLSCEKERWPPVFFLSWEGM